MKIKIKENARELYCEEQSQMNNVQYSKEWEDILGKIQGTTIEVETEHLFKDQYNTVPIPGVSEIGLRVMQESVEEVIDDERIGKAKCHYCHTIVPANSSCPKCGTWEHIENFQPTSSLIRKDDE